MKSFIKYFLKSLVSIGIIFFICYKYIDADNLISGIVQINYFWLFVALVLYLFSKWVNSYQMKICFESFKLNLSTPFIFKTQMITSLYAFILPGDLSAGVSWYLLARNNNKKAEVAAGLIYLRVLNLISLIPFGLIAVIVEPRLKEFYFQYYLLIFSLILVLAILPFYISSINKFYKKIISAIASLLFWGNLKQRISSSNEKLWHQVILINKINLIGLIKIAILSLILQLILIGFTYFNLLSVGINIPFYFSGIIIIALTIIYMIPITISGIGLREIVMIQLLGLSYQVSAEKVMLSSITNLIIALFCGGLLGGWYNITIKKEI